MRQKFQSTSPVWGMTMRKSKYRTETVISIHIPRVGDDHIMRDCFRDGMWISIHIPRVGDDCGEPANKKETEIFQSTSPVWGMTLRRRRDLANVDHFNPHPPCGG